MARVTVIGLGAMGSVLARVLAESGHEVTAWNRSPLTGSRAPMLSRAAVKLASSPAEAIAASPLTVMCVLDIPAAEAVLDAPGAGDALRGRTLVQLSNGNEAEERRQLARVEALGGRLLVGGIIGYPRHIGLPDTVILYAGSASAFAEHGDTLAALAGGQRFLGEDLAPRNATYVAGFCFYFAALTGFLESAALADAGGVTPSQFAAAMPGVTALVLDHMADAARRIEAGDFAGDQATVDVHLVGALRRQRGFADVGLQGLASGAYLAYCEQAHDAGEGGEDIAALYKRIKDGRRP